MTAPSEAVISPTIDQSPHRLFLLKHRACAQEDLAAVMGSTFDALYKRIGAAGVAPAGPPFVIYREGSEPGVMWEMDICAPIATPITAAPDFDCVEMPPQRIISLMHVGPYDQLGRAYEAIEWFMRDNELTPQGSPREIYLSEPDVPPSEIRTLIEQPIA